MKLEIPRKSSEKVIELSKKFNELEEENEMIDSLIKYIKG